MTNLATTENITKYNALAYIVFAEMPLSKPVYFSNECCGFCLANGNKPGCGPA